MNYTNEQLRELRRMTRETPMGECFEWNGVKYEVVNPRFAKKPCALVSITGCCPTACGARERSDETVIFVKAEGGAE